MKALPIWLIFVALLRFFAVYLGLFDIGKFKIALIDKKPELVTPLFGRVFAAWTVVTCMLCVATARNYKNKPILIATACSFAVAIAVFTLELNVFETQSWRGLISPMCVAGISTVWILAHLRTKLDESAEGSSVTALRRYLYLVALGRLWSVYEALAQPETYGPYLFSLKPYEANDLALRIFAAWLVVSIVLALICSQNPTDPPIYGAMLFSSVLGVAFYASEVWLFKTALLEACAWHLAVHSLTAIWMGLFWNYYTKYSKISPSGSKGAAGENGVHSSTEGIKQE